MSETVINVPGRFNPIEYGTPLANASDIYDTNNEKSVQETLNDENNKIALQDTKINTLNTVGSLVETSDGSLSVHYNIGDIFYKIQYSKNNEIKYYYVAKVDGFAGDNINDTEKFINAGTSSVNALNIKTTIIKGALQGDDAYGVYVKQWIKDHPSLEPTTENGFLEQDEWLEYIRGKSALQIYNDLHPDDQLNEQQFIEMLKAKYPMKYVSYDGAADAADVGDELDTLDGNTAASTYEHGLYLMPNNSTSPTGSVLFICVNGASGYKWVKMGDVSIPTNVATKEEIKDLDYKFNGKIDLQFDNVDIDSLSLKNYMLTSNGNWNGNSTYKHISININDEKFIKIKPTSSNYSIIGFLTEDNASSNAVPAYVENTTTIVIPADKEYIIPIPDSTNVIICSYGKSSDSYPYKPSYIGLATSYVIDSFDSDETKKPISAAKGKALKEMVDETNTFINEVNKRTFKEKKLLAETYYYDRILDVNDGSVVSMVSQDVPLSGISPLLHEGDIVHIVANEQKASRIAFLKNNLVNIGEMPSYMEEEGFNEMITLIPNEERYFTIPEDGYMFWNVRNSNYAPVTTSLRNLSFPVNEYVEDNNIVTIHPFFMYEAISNSSSFVGDFSRYDAKRSIICTPRFIKCKGNIISITSPISCYACIFFYDNNFTYKGFEQIHLEANVETAYNIEEYNYIKFRLQINETVDVDNDVIPFVNLSVKGNFESDWDTFNPRSSDEGYHRIAVQVNVTNPTCCDNMKYSVSYNYNNTDYETEGILTDVDELPSEGFSEIIYHVTSGANKGFYMYVNDTWMNVTIQHMLASDTQELLCDFGVIALPEFYTNVGKPTRLIIYCHGAAVNYTSSVSRFNAKDLEPAYWLAEGYAVMDIEGNPYNNDDEHCSIPQSIDCYVAAYNWAINHYNLCKDGVFLGGRSMGGGQTVALLRKDCSIPIIAACPNVPALAMGTSSVPDRKLFWLNHCGFNLPEGFTPGNGYIESEKGVFLDNWDKWVKVLPLFSLITDLPVGIEGKREVIDKLWLWSYSDEYDNYFKTFHGYAKCPVKFFAINQDEGGLRFAKIAYQILLNSCQKTELRIINSYKDYSGTGTTAHHADTQDPALRTTVTTKFGVEMTNIPIVYIEMLQFWRRYEQGN